MRPVAIRSCGRALTLAPEQANASLCVDQLPTVGSQSTRFLPFANEDPASSGPEVILWADTFNNYYRPEVSRAALEVLTHAGFKVRVSRDHFCCGRPLYDFGMLDKARQYLERILAGPGSADRRRTADRGFGAELRLCIPR